LIDPTRPRSVPLLILDLDGTVREGKDDALGRFVNGPEDVRVFPEAKIMMHRWKAGGGRIIAVTNQGGIALGLVSRAKVFAALEETYKQCDGLFDKMCICTHHPNAPDPDEARCWCRKPLPGLIIDGVSDLAIDYGERYPPYMALMVGDRDEDEACAKMVNIDFKWAHEWRALASEGS
jgi:D-glycero-D-manno-heptose 1,7-bisphosphate phosphatase